MVGLTQKPHQEHITDINEFVWRMCVSYRRLNAVTKPFQCPVPRCDDAITILGCRVVLIWILRLDVRQGYHQVAVRFADQEKLAFFTPSDEKLCFTVIPFGPTNAPGLYTAMMKDFKTEWDDLFIIRVTAMKTYNSLIIRVDSNQDVIIGGVKLVWGSKTIIDDILLWRDKKELTLLLFTCVCEFFQKYRVSFQFDKYEFLKKTSGICGAR